MTIYFIKAYGEWDRGDSADLPREDALRIVRAGAAIFTPIPPVREKASLEPQAERAVMPEPSKPKRGRPKKAN